MRSRSSEFIAMLEGQEPAGLMIIEPLAVKHEFTVVSYLARRRVVE